MTLKDLAEVAEQYTIMRVRLFSNGKDLFQGPAHYILKREDAAHTTVKKIEVVSLTDYDYLMVFVEDHKPLGRVYCCPDDFPEKYILDGVVHYRTDNIRLSPKSWTLSVQYTLGDRKIWMDAYGVLEEEINDVN